MSLRQSAKDADGAKIAAIAAANTKQVNLRNWPVLSGGSQR
jgi:hypothetical protein